MIKALLTTLAIVGICFSATQALAKRAHKARVVYIELAPVTARDARRSKKTTRHDRTLRTASYRQMRRMHATYSQRIPD